MTKWLAAALLLLGATAQADDITWALGSDTTILERAREAAAAVAPESRRVVTLDYRVHLHFGEQVSRAVQVVYFYPTAESVQESATDHIVWDAVGEQLTVLEAATLKGDGSVARLDPATVEILDRDAYDMFTDDVDVVLQLPGIEPGSITMLSYRQTLMDATHAHFREWALGNGRSPYREFLITWDEKPPAWQADEPLACESAEKQVRCRIVDGEAATLDRNVFYADVLPQLVVAVERDWEEVIAAMRPLVDVAAEDRSSLASILAEARASDDPLAHVHDLVARQIRYVSFSRGEHSHAPHAIGETLANRYGDCKDKSTLLYALLSELGYDAYPVLVATNRQRPERLGVPRRGYFDHMVVCMSTSEGEHCLDPTDAFTGSRHVPRSIQGKVRLDLAPGRQPARVLGDEYRWRFEADVALAFSAEGGQQETTTRTLGGAYASWLRGVLSVLDDDDQQTWLRQEHQQTISGGEEHSFELAGLGDVEGPLQVSGVVRYSGIVDPAAALKYVDGAYWMRSFLSDERITNEHYDAEFAGVHLTSTHRFDLAGHWVPTQTGAQVQFESRFGAFERTYRVADNQVVVRTEVRMPASEVKVGEFAEFNRFLDLAIEETEIRFWGALSEG